MARVSGTQTPTQAPKSPFLPSNPARFPELCAVDYPVGPLAELEQQMECSAVPLPFERVRHSVFREWRPAMAAPPTFKHAHAAFCSARRLVAPPGRSAAELCTSAQTAELEAHRQRVTPPGGIMPRGVAVNLIVPHCTYSSLKRSQSAQTAIASARPLG